MDELTSRSKVSSLATTSALELDDHMEDETNVSLVDTPMDMPPHGRHDESEDNGSRSAYPHTVDGRQGPCETFRELYKAHDPVWFLPKYKVWFCDRDMMGKLIIVRFDPRRGCIEGYQVLAVNDKQTFEEWPARNDVFILSFEPHVKLHLDKPVLQLNIGDMQNVRNYATRTGANRFAAEVPMMRGDHRDLIFNNFMLARPLDSGTAGAKHVPKYPYDYVWPPPAVPSDHRVRSDQSVVGNIAPHDTPMSRGEISHQTFRIRQWTQMTETGSPLTLLGDQNGGIAGLLGVVAELGNVVNAGGVHLGEEVITYSTLDTVLYTPTESKPWRGIWVGDYSGHGCEFLLIHQPDDPAVTDAELGLIRRVDETDEAWEKRRREAHIYRGRLEAIKLTGDPNVPRGEYTFVADDLGPEGFVGIASHPPFVGTRIVKSRGHVAGTGFVNGTYQSA
ncbi:hypothetical protein E4U30_000948 [Claviceps sp. LM220 group G6]|nr:hypothetical protein E4U15_004096 [Claviceps sp. LM218 group G6]KAG6097154.1 hypothetical protein E4U30_000948 [Claviceps sp. LM220 group G6]